MNALIDKIKLTDKGLDIIKRILFLLLFFYCENIISQNKTKAFVYFKFNDFSLDIKSKRRIDSLISNKALAKIYLQGHTDSIGSNKYNDVLSSKRVIEVKNYLIAQNIREEIIEIKALGKKELLNTSSSENERALNRRVEIELILSTTYEKTVTPIKKDSTLIAFQEVIINGIVTDENKQPIVSEILLHDKNGNEILSTLSGHDGKYKFKANLNKKEDYTLVYYNDSSFISSRRINLSDKRLSYKNLKTILPKLKGGNKYILENFNFIGDTSQLISSSIPSLESLYKLMKKNKSLVIQIEGHVNYPNYWPNPKRNYPHSDKYVPPHMNYEEFNQWLSDERAKMVYDFLVAKGINAKRLTTKGYGSSKMLYPDAVSEVEQAQNRRVEINVISFKK